jgi:hypothetical protein
MNCVQITGNYSKYFLRINLLKIIHGMQNSYMFQRHQGAIYTSILKQIILKF